MTQLSVMDLAKQGDPHAIAALINRSLASKGIHAEAELKFDCLTISLQALVAASIFFVRVVRYDKSMQEFKKYALLDEKRQWSQILII